MFIGKFDVFHMICFQVAQAIWTISKFEIDSLLSHECSSELDNVLNLSNIECKISLLNNSSFEAIGNGCTVLFQIFQQTGPEAKILQRWKSFLSRFSYENICWKIYFSNQKDFFNLSFERVRTNSDLLEQFL